MSQSNIIAGCLFLAFVVYVTMKGELGTYMGLLFGTMPAGASSSDPLSSLLGGLGSLFGGSSTDSSSSSGVTTSVPTDASGGYVDPSTGLYVAGGSGGVVYGSGNSGDTGLGGSAGLGGSSATGAPGSGGSGSSSGGTSSGSGNFGGTSGVGIGGSGPVGGGIASPKSFGEAGGGSTGSGAGAGAGTSPTGSGSSPNGYSGGDGGVNQGVSGYGPAGSTGVHISNPFGSLTSPGYAPASPAIGGLYGSQPSPFSQEGGIGNTNFGPSYNPGSVNGFNTDGPALGNTGAYGYGGISGGFGFGDPGSSGYGGSQSDGASSADSGGFGTSGGMGAAGAGGF